MGGSISSLSGIALFFVLISLIIGPSYALDTIGIADINGTKVYMANLTDNATEGNWIHLSGGNAVELPEMTLNYSVKNASYTKGSSVVNLSTHAGKGSVKYPYKYHRYYLNGSNVSGIFYGGSSLNNSIVDYYLIKTSSTELNDTLSDLLDGNATSFENMLDGADRDGSVTANSSGDAKLSLSYVPSGSYALLLLLNKSSYSNLSIPTGVNYTILSSTVVEVVEFPMQVSTNVDSDSVDISMKVSNTTTCSKGYKYGAVAIRDDAYTYSMDLVSNGSKASTNATINDVPVIEGFDILGLDLGNVNESVLLNKTGSIIGSGNGAVAFSDKIKDSSASIHMILNNPGGSKLMTGVWSYCSGEKLVSFKQTTLPTGAKHVPAGGGGGGAPPAPITGIFTGLTDQMFQKVLDAENLLYRNYVKVPGNALASLLSISHRSFVFPSFEGLEDMVKEEPREEEGDVYNITASRVLEEYNYVNEIILARGDLRVDSYAATALSKAHRTPILLTRPKELPQATLETIEEVKPSKITIVGGPEAVSEDVEHKLKEKAEVTRLWGPTRVETSAEIAKEFGLPEYIVVAGWDSNERAAYLGYLYEAPVLYTRGGELPSAVEPYLEDKLGSYQEPKVVFVGVSDKVKEEVEALSSQK